MPGASRSSCRWPKLRDRDYRWLQPDLCALYLRPANRARGDRTWDLELINLAHFGPAGRMGPSIARFPPLPQPEFPQAAGVQGKQAEAGYVTASYQRYPFFAYGEMHSPSIPITAPRLLSPIRGGVIDYASETQNLFEFVDDKRPTKTATPIGSAIARAKGLAARGVQWAAIRRFFPGLRREQRFHFRLQPKTKTAARITSSRSCAIRSIRRNFSLAWT